MESLPADAKPLPRKIGRPLSFDRAAVLHRAMLAFWRQGYETTSIADLTAAMGVTAPSIYAAFGDKRRLFLEAVRLYSGDPEDAARAIDGAPSARVAAHDMLVSAAIMFTGETTPRGCLLASATATGSPASADVRQAVGEIRRCLDACLQRRIERDVMAGTLPSETQPAALSGMILAVIQGLSALARDGAPRERLLAIADATMRAWPGEGRRRRHRRAEPASNVRRQ